MATFNQIYKITNAITSQAFGEGVVAPITNTEQFISLGKYVLSNPDNTDAFYSAIPDVIGRIVTRYQSLKRRTRDIEKSPLDFGLILAEIEIDEIARVKPNRSWETGIVNAWASQELDANGDAQETGKDDTKFTIVNYKVLAGWEANKVIYDYQLKTGFHSEAEMGAFYAAVFNDMYNAMIQALNDAEATAECCAIAQEITGANEFGQLTGVNVAQAYYDFTGEDITDGGTAAADAWMKDKDFLQFVTFKITGDITKAQQVSNFYTCQPTTDSGKLDGNSQPITYNLERELSDYRIHVLGDFARACEWYLLSNTYHENFVKLGGYTEVVAWQGRLYNKAEEGQDPVYAKDTFQSNSFVGVYNTEGLWKDAGKEGAPAPFKCDGVIAHVFADGRMISMIDNIRTKSQYNPIGERTVYAHKADIGYAVRPKEIGITYYIGEVDTGD